MKILKRSLLDSAVKHLPFVEATSLPMRSFAAVQSHATPSVDRYEVDTIQIHQLLSSVVKSLNTKRASNSVVNAMTSENIGKYFSQNVAEPLQSVTDVSITHNLGEGELDSIREPDIGSTTAKKKKPNLKIRFRMIYKKT